ncbi:MAG TPA: glutamine-hydrolyzing carbamoyl-phosphate synthase small subunit [Alphaproteobacteria bacterium]|nr:glutamine-hydrolyzing carbamoyl-phosphate synthase small subunit [Alphaproteobacteria bacterium]
MPDLTEPAAKMPEKAPTAVLVLEDGAIYYGHGIGATGTAVGEVCFNTSMTGYQEILTDPSYAGQIITFTFPHIGNVGANEEDIETTTVAARGLVLREPITEPANFRATRTLNDWLTSRNLIGITGVDTRQLTRRIRLGGAPKGIVCHNPDGVFDIGALQAEAQAWPGLLGMDLVKDVSCTQTYNWNETRWTLGSGYGRQSAPDHHIVAVDYGIKRNILRCLASNAARLTVVPGYSTAEDILKHKPDGVFLSNGPGDPAATGAYAVPAIKGVIESGLPVFGICLGHQMLALAMGAKTIKMHQGHRGANHPVKDFTTNKVEITSMNHGFTVSDDDLPDTLEVTHRSLFDGTICGLRIKDQPVFSVQYHPEASPGPQDSHYLFDRFVAMIKQHA